MKEQSLAKIRSVAIGLLFVLIILQSSIIFGQQSSTPVKFDELALLESSYSETDQVVKERVDRYVAEARRQKGKIKYLVAYRARIRDGGKFWNRSSDWAARVRAALAAITGEWNDDAVLIVDGGVREIETLEFWFLPKGTDLPKPSPTFEVSEAIDCPRLLAYQDDIAFSKERPITFKAEAYPPGTNDFNWTVTDGTVITEMGSRISVDISRAKSDRITAFVEFKGLPLPCKNAALATAEFGNTPRLIDRFDLTTTGVIRGRMDNFLTELMNHPDKRGYIYIYGGRNEKTLDSQARRRLLMNHIHFRKFDRQRVSLVDAGFREILSTDLWLVPAGIDAPPYTPTVDAKFANPPSTPLRNRRKK